MVTRDSHLSVRVGITLLIAAAAIGVAVLFAEKVSRKMPDIVVPWTTGARARAAEPLYRTDDGHYQFKYLPAFAILAIPLALASLQTAKAVWFVVSVALLGLLIVQSLALLPERRRPAWALVVITTVVMAKFYGHELVLGQMNIPFAVVTTGAVLAARRGQEWMTGLLIALAIVVKPYGVIFMPWLVARRRGGSIAAAVVGCVAIIALPAVVYGLQSDIELHRDWWHTVTTSTAPNLTNADNVSIAGMWTKWIGFGRPAAILAAATSVVVLALATWAFVRRHFVTAPDALEASMLLTLIPLLSPQGWDYVFLISTPAIMLLVNYDDRLPRAIQLLTRLALGVIALSIYDVMGREAYGTFMSLSIITLCYFVVIGALCALRARAVA